MKNINTLTGTKKSAMAVHSTYEVRWKNFKGFKDTRWIKIKPITILIGSNNSGKTSFITPLLLMNQTISSRDSTSPLIIKGNLYDGGNIKEIINNYDTRKNMFFGFRYHIHDKPKKIKPVGTYAPGAFEVIIGKNKNKDVIVKRETIYDMFLRKYLSIYKDANNDYKISIHGFKLDEDEVELLKKISPINFLFTPNVLLSAYEQLYKKDEEKKSKNFSEGFQELLRVISRNFSDSSDSLMNLSYLGPIRENPHRYYEISDEKYLTVGQKGENTPYLLKSKLSKIKRELNKWVRKFGFGNQINLNDLHDKLLYSITFKNKNSRHETNIANTGFGASQILPLIVQALVSGPESIVIAEQPEIHLNPKLQGVLAELFALMVKKDQRVIVETHSEHLILRIRRLIAKKTLKANDVALYFVEKKPSGSSIREIKIEDNGHINSAEWPDDFFEDTLSESLALASEQAKHRNN